MLDCPLDQPHEALGSLVRVFLSDPPWIERRVETVAFLDSDTVVRRSTVDVGMPALEAAVRTLPINHSRPLAPLATLRKELLVDFDLRDGTGGALPVASRDISALLGWSALVVEAERVLNRCQLPGSRSLAQHLHQIALAFPDPTDDPLKGTPQSWTLPPGWSGADRECWLSLMRSDDFVGLLRDLTFSFLLLTELETGPSVRVVKFSYQQHLPATNFLWRERLGLRHSELEIDVPSIGWGRAHHLRLEAPAGLNLTEVGLFRVSPQDSIADGAGHKERSMYQRRKGAETVHLYTTASVSQANHVVAVAMRVPVVGYLRAIWVTTLFVATVLLTGRVYLERVETAVANQADAAVAMLLVGPTLLTAYLVRPGEHAIAARLLRPVRTGVGVVGTATYVAAGSLFLGVKGAGLAHLWTVLCLVSGSIALFLSVVIILTTRDLVRSRQTEGQTETVPIVEVAR